MDKKKLHITKGASDVSSINQNLRKNLKKFSRKRKKLDYYISGISQGNKTILSEAITIIESQNSKDMALAKAIVKACLPLSGKSIRVGITGVPGVGKSTFIDSFGAHLCNHLGKKIAVLAVDPSSNRSGGSILGDKTRMETLTTIDNAFIRPSPTANNLGGVAKKTRETIILCEAAGFDTILIETVGVGQSETTVHSMVDFFLLLMLAGAGDELQGIKKGIMEMADTMIITKADGENVLNCKKAKMTYQSALHLFPPHPTGWIPPVLLTSSLENEGIQSVWNTVEDFKKQSISTNYFRENRINQNLYWFRESIQEQLFMLFKKNKRVKEELHTLETLLKTEKTTAFEASEQLFNTFLEEIKKQND
ncbi:MAG: methylmalonyl Co-A mutase-associated GTPase MeaB [Flavobacteriales bacterium]|nr:methylmalonyl Co-A mutase-associated GTPase MeaB [Flavobacteriales bacterium]